ncbi:N-methylhydantoinase B/oxoprolinase/acetone carboxylase alpha subunit [Bradyrhizobium liaoningense]
MIEANYAIRLEQQAIRRQSGGAGAQRGGDGSVRTYRILAPSMHLTTCIERMVIAPWGMQGGESGKACRISLVRHGANVAIDGKSNLVLQQDDLVTIEMCGGGGYGAAAAE